MDPDTDVCQTEQPQISYSFDFTAEQSRAIQSPNLLGREGRVLQNLHLPGLWRRSTVTNLLREFAYTLSV